jgi:hypothetical protein
MSKVITFSRYFPAYHPRKGQPTEFVEKIWNSMPDIDFEKVGESNQHLPEPEFDLFLNELRPTDIMKHHTIRAGNRWKAGDKFSPRVWSGKPYNSKQIIIAPDIEIKKVWPVEIWIALGCIYIAMPTSDRTHLMLPFRDVATNDGLSFVDMQYWFNVKPNKPFNGQIICWADHIEY